MAKQSSSESYWAIVRRQFFKRKLAIFGLLVVMAFFLVALLAPLLANDKPIVAGYQGRLYFPAFTTYLEAYPVPQAIARPLQRWQLWKGYRPFSPHYAVLEGRTWKEALRKKIPLSEGETEGGGWKLYQSGEDGTWALMPLIPHGFKSFDSRIRTRGPGDPGLEGRQHYLGTDKQGHDVLARLIYGTIVAMSVGLISVSIYVTIGIIVGSIAGYFGGWVDLLISRVIEVVISFPTLFLILAISAVWGPSIYGIIIMLGLIRWTGTARLIRGEILKTKRLDFVTAAQAQGFGHRRIIFKHLVPNCLAPVLVTATFGISQAILIESSLSFLGFGIQPPMASWGEIGKQGRELIANQQMYMAVVAGLATFASITAFNLVGEGLRDAMDPRLKT